MRNMPIYMLHMKSVSSTIGQGVLYTNDDDANTNANANNNDDNNMITLAEFTTDQICQKSILGIHEHC